MERHQATQLVLDKAVEFASLLMLEMDKMDRQLHQRFDRSTDEEEQSVRQLRRRKANLFQSFSSILQL